MSTCEYLQWVHLQTILNFLIVNMTDRVLSIAVANPTSKCIVLHTGANDIVKRQSEMLKRDFDNLLNTVSSLNAEVFISGHLPPVRGRAESFSRLLTLNTWLSTACDAHSVHFIGNFNFFWDRHLFQGDGLHLNRSGVKLCTSNLSFFLCHTVPSAKVKIQEESKQKEDTSKHGEPTLPLQDVSLTSCERRQDKEEKDATLAPLFVRIHSPKPPEPCPVHHLLWVTSSPLPPCWSSLSR